MVLVSVPMAAAIVVVVVTAAFLYTVWLLLLLPEWCRCRAGCCKNFKQTELILLNYTLYTVRAVVLIMTFQSLVVIAADVAMMVMVVVVYELYLTVL